MTLHVRILVKKLRSWLRVVVPVVAYRVRYSIDNMRLDLLLYIVQWKQSP